MRSDPFADAVLKSQRKVRGYALLLTHQREDAEDLAQETFARAFKYRDHFKVGTNMASWLYTIARNLHVATVRHNRVLRVGGLSDTQPHGGNLENQVIARMDIERVLQDADPVLAMAGAGMGRREMAILLNTTTMAVHCRVHRARVLARAQVA